MVSRFVVGLRKQGWSANVQPHVLCDKWTIGDQNCDISVPDCPCGISISVQNINAGIFLSIEGAAFKEEESNSILIPFGDTKRLHPYSPETGENYFSISIYPYQNTTLSADLQIVIPDNREICIGGNPESDIFVNHSLIHSPIVNIRKESNRWLVIPQVNVPLGLYHNTRAINSLVYANKDDFLTCIGFQLQFSEQGFIFSDADNLKVKGLQYTTQKSVESNYPCLNRSPRHLSTKPSEVYTIQDPPTAPQENKSNILISLLPIIAMILLTFFLRGSYSSQSSMILFSTLSMAVGGIGSILTYLQTGKDYRRKSERRKTEYQNYIAECERKIDEMRKREHTILHDIYISAEEEIHRAQSFSSELFDRRPEDEDFLDIRFGYGRIRSSQPIHINKHEVFEQTDDLNNLPRKVLEKYVFTEDLPVYIQGTSANATGIVGGKAEQAAMLKTIMLDVTTRHYNKDVRIFAFLPSFYQEELYAMRLFPHLNTLGSDRHSLAYDEDSYTFLTETLYKEISIREEAGSTIEHFPWLVIIVSTELQNVMRHPLMESVSNASKYRLLFVFMSESKQYLPQGCSTVVYLMGNCNMGMLSYINTELPDQLFTCETVKTSDLQAASEVLAPVFCGDSQLSTRLSPNETLFNMLGVHSVDDLSIETRWQQSDSITTLSAPIGILDSGEVLMLDLHENGQGPHGLVAGTTGAGKSQVLISYILSLSSTYSPDELTFAVIDFKGGDIVKQLPGLPHIVGSITNIEQNEIERSLRSINAEKNRRMILFDRDHANVSNISEYIAAYRAGRVKDPLPHLVIIVDEFAELKSQYPDFLQALISLARVGRSLGIHLILCTQKPGGGVVDPQIWSNSNFRLCLRVQNRDDSNEVLHSPLAAEIHERGRGYLQAEPGIFELFQSGYSGAPEIDSIESEKGYTITQLDLAGRPYPLYIKEGKNNGSHRTQREAVLQKIINTFSDSHIKNPLPLCQPSIPNVIPYENLKSEKFGEVPVGLLDDPDNQRVLPLIVDLIGKNTLIVGNTQMGKTNLLLTILRWLSENMSVSDVMLYAMDFNTNSIKAMQDISIVGGVVIDRDEERLKNLFKLLYQEIAQRKALFDESRAANYSAYRQTHNDLPVIVVMLDNYAVFHELYNDQYGDELLNLVRDGVSYGITFIMTVQHISSLSYKLTYYFSQRIVMCLSEKTEYASVLEGCRTTLGEVPGKVLVSMNKAFYEGQIFEAFSAKNEPEKAALINEFVKTHLNGSKARMIPGIPDTLDYDFITDNYSGVLNKNRIVYGMEFESIEPVCLNMGVDFLLSIIGGNEQYRLSVTRMLIINASVQVSQPQIYIFDDAMRSLRDLRENPAITRYCYTPDDIQIIITDIMSELERRKQSSFSDDEALDKFTPIIVVINSEDLIRYISDQAVLISSFKRIFEEYSRMKVFFLFSNVPNRTIRYNSPELLRIIGEEQKALILCDLVSVKTFEISGAIVRSQGRPIGINEAFLLNREDVSRIKLISNN